MKTLGILGGMGPEATALFYSLLVRHTPASRDQEHIPVLMIADPRVPDRSEFLEGGGQSPLPVLMRGVSRLESWGAELIVIPCNTAHFFWRELQDEVRIPILNIVEETASAMEAAPGSSLEPLAAVLGTKGTASSGLYQRSLARRGIEVFALPEEEQDVLQSIICRIKAGQELENLREGFEALLAALEQRSVRSAILGCTELPILARISSSPIALWDSLEILAKAAVREALAR